MASAEHNVKVAIITGGASGLGLETAKSLAKKGDWQVHILDLNKANGEAAAQQLGSGAQFHENDVSDYATLSAIFDRIFQLHHRIDFVFANAGMIENVDFFAKHDPSKSPPELDQRVINVNLQSVINTTYLALHYFRQCPDVPLRNLIITGSVGSLYPTFSIPMYCAAKHGLLGFTRSIARYLEKDGIRVNVILPGVVATALLTAEELDTYPKDSFTPVEQVVDTVLQVISGKDMTDANGRMMRGEEICGAAIEINIRNFYFRDQPDWCDEKMQGVMEATDR